MDIALILCLLASTFALWKSRSLRLLESSRRIVLSVRQRRAMRWLKFSGVLLLVISFILMELS